MNEKTKNKLINFFNKYQLVKYKKGQILMKPKQKLEGIPFIKSGYVRVYTISKDGKEITLPLFKSIFFASLISQLTGKENTYYFESLSPVEMWLAPEKEVMKFITEDKELYDALTKFIISDFIDLTSNIQQLIYGDAYTKVASLIYSTSNKFGKAAGNKVAMKFTLPHRMIASMTGLTRETVTLQILKLEKDGLVTKKGRHMIVKDLDKLKKAAML